MTRGVSGTVVLDLRRSDMLKDTGGRAEQGMAPTMMRRNEAKPEGQRKEW